MQTKNLLKKILTFLIYNFVSVQQVDDFKWILIILDELWAISWYKTQNCMFERNGQIWVACRVQTCLKVYIYRETTSVDIIHPYVHTSLHDNNPAGICTHLTLEGALLSCLRTRVSTIYPPPSTLTDTHMHARTYTQTLTNKCVPPPAYCCQIFLSHTRNDTCVRWICHSWYAVAPSPLCCSLSADKPIAKNQST